MNHMYPHTVNLYLIGHSLMTSTKRGGRKFWPFLWMVADGFWGEGMILLLQTAACTISKSFFPWYVKKFYIFWLTSVTLHTWQWRYLRNCQISMMTLFVKNRCKAFQPSHIFAKISIIEVWQGSKYTSAWDLFKLKGLMMETQEVRKSFMELSTGNICHLTYLFSFVHETCKYCELY